MAGQGVTHPPGHRRVWIELSCILTGLVAVLCAPWGWSLLVLGVCLWRLVDHHHAVE